MAKRTPGLEMAKSILPKAIHALGRKQETEYYAHWVMWHWQEIVGEAVARHVRPLSIRNRVLRLYTPDSVWANEMRMMMPQVIGEVNRFAGGEMVKEIQFSRSFQAQEERAECSVREAKERDIGRARAHISLSAETMEAVRSSCRVVEDEDLQAAVRCLYRKHKQMEALRQEDGWHDCPSCGARIESEECLCFACRRKKRAALRAAVRSVLRDMPWARCKDVRAFVPECTPKLVNEARALLVQQLAAEVKLEDDTSLSAKALVMLYACLPPDELTEDAVRRTLYRLRFDLHRPKDYKAPKRYAIIPLGRKRNG